HEPIIGNHYHSIHNLPGFLGDLHRNHAFTAAILEWIAGYIGALANPALTHDEELTRCADYVYRHYPVLQLSILAPPFNTPDSPGWPSASRHNFLSEPNRFAAPSDHKDFLRSVCQLYPFEIVIRFQVEANKSVRPEICELFEVDSLDLAVLGGQEHV